MHCTGGGYSHDQDCAKAAQVQQKQQKLDCHVDAAMMSPADVTRKTQGKLLGPNIPPNNAAKDTKCRKCATSALTSIS